MASLESNLETGPHDNKPGDSSENAVEMKSLDTNTSTVEASKDAAASSSAAHSHQDMSQSAGLLTGAGPAHQSTIASASPVGAAPELSSSSNTPAAAVSSTAEPTATAAAAPELSRLDSVAIGPSTDANADPTITDHEAGPVCVITLILHSGARHPYTLDEKYLNKRKVNVPDVTESGKKDPFSISVYTLKELILREWRQEWEAQPSSPSSIRLIHFGKFLEDSKSLKGISIPNIGEFSVHAANTSLFLRVSIQIRCSKCASYRS